VSARYRTRRLDGGRVVELRTADGRSMQYRRVGQAVYAVTAERPGSLGWQVCERLQGAGNTITAVSDEALARVIRREARRIQWGEGGEAAYLREVRP
jgi:hypothetical protein